MRGRRWGGLVALVAIAGCRLNFDEQALFDAAGSDTVQVQVVTFGERATSLRSGVTMDTLLNLDRASSNYGGAWVLGTYAPAPYRNHSLIRFELGEVSQGLIVRAARLELVLVDLEDTRHGTLELRGLTESWSEGTHDAEKGPGANWFERDVGEPWQTAGGTVAPALVGSLTPDPVHGPIEIEIDPSIVQRWLDAPATNHGLRIESAGTQTHYHFVASEADEEEARPQLVLELAP